MKPLHFITGLIKLIVVSILLSGLLAMTGFVENAQTTAFTIFAVLLLASCLVPVPKHAAYDVVMEVWANYIMERFYKDNAFLRNSFDDSGYVLNGRIVHIPQPGAKPNVVVNRNAYPAAAVRRADTDVLYALDELTTDPTHIPNIDQIHISYNKADDVLGDHMQTVDETAAELLLRKWAANANTYRTTGAQIVNGNPAQLTVAPIAGQVGNRYAFTHRDLKNLMTQFNTTNAPKQDRYILIDDNMYDAFYDTLGETNAKDFSRYSDAENGVIGKLHSFNIMTRSSVMASDNADAIKALGSAMGADDNLVSLAWHKNSVARAMGDKKLFQKLGDPQYYGDVHSALVMFGGRVRRADGVGIYKIIQGVPQA